MQVWAPRAEFSQFVIETLFSGEPPEHQSHFKENHGDISIFHSACWDHLTRFFGTIDLDLKSILDIFSDIQFRRYFLPDTIKGKDSTSLTVNQEIRGFFLLIPIKASWNPLLPTRPVFMTRNYHLVSPSLIKRRERLATTHKEYQRDPFDRLPTEIKLEITEFMSTNDYLHLRQVSRAMFSLFDSPAFWRARFRTHSDRGYLEFLADPNVEGNWDTLEAEDWRKIYRQTSIRGTVAGPPTKSTKGTKNPSSKGRPAGSKWIHSRHGVWIKMKWLQTQLEISNMMTEIANEVSQFELVNTDINIKWYWQIEQAPFWDSSTSSSSSNSSTGNFNNMNLCRPPYYRCYLHDKSSSHVSIQKLVLHESVTQIGFWVAAFDDQTYITGLELISDEESIPNGTMGYRSSNTELFTVDIGSAEELRGFQVYSINKFISGVRLYIGPQAESIPGKSLKFRSSEWVSESPQSNSRSNIDYYGKSSGKRIVGLGASFSVS
ncbi:hypothetical protein N7493_003802 [Penicillium malachiteum]|uniref:F-box domain-containing protein n=1 Tax=Penicillium malachiteum TaxID=1324776 RepID=A0AAD6MY07_9EURO|nr:hypothetical protein N7493_003802 [Penicillium malachiteum]